MAYRSPLACALLASALLSSTALAQTAPDAAPVAAPAPAPAPVVVETPTTTVIVQPPSVQPAPAPPPPPAAAPAAPAPPQTEPWSNVSHVNGTLVPVGQKNEYVYTYRRTNVSTNPIGWILGIYGASLSYGIHQNIAIRGDINYYAPVDEDERGFEIGVGLPLYFRRTYQGAFLEPGFIVRATSVDGCDGCGDTAIGPQVLAGWHWTWDSGFNVAAAFGIGRNWSTEDDYVDAYGNHYDDDEEIFANGYLRFGYAF